MNSALVLLLAAAGVGFGHAVLPDHWAPLAVLARTRKDPLHRVVRRSLAAAGTHVALSLLLGAVLIVVGLRFRDTVLRYEDYVVGGLLLATGAAFLALELTGRGHGHSHEGEHGHSHGGRGHDRSDDQHRDHAQDHAHSHDQGHAHADGHDHADPHAHGHDHAEPHLHAHPHPHTPSSRPGRLQAAAALAIPFGAAASPDLTILPVFLAASALGAATAVGSLLVFAGVTMATIVGLTVAASLGVARLTGPWVERRANLLTAGTLLAFGALIALGVI
jgi:nickel/cobalt transporter (NicO) family protein